MPLLQSRQGCLSYNRGKDASPTAHRPPLDGFDSRDVTKCHKMSHILADAVVEAGMLLPQDTGRSQPRSNFPLVAAVPLTDGFDNWDVTSMSHQCHIDVTLM